MSKKIETLAQDIKQDLTDSVNGKGKPISVDELSDLGFAIANKVSRSLTKGPAFARPRKVLYASEIGAPCLRQTWYKYHMPASGDKLLPNNVIKFLYGDILEELALFLAKRAGHLVEAQQERVEIALTNGWKIVGRQDAIIDGAVVDVKSASPYSYKKIVGGLDNSNDTFGYRMQLATYAAGMELNHATNPKNTGFLVVDKQNGNIAYKETPTTSLAGVIATGNEIVTTLESSSPPARHFPLVPEGKSGNEKLGIECSYCPFKRECWKDTNGGMGLRAFAYGWGPVFLGTIKREPRVPEIDLNRTEDEATAAIT